LLHSPEIEAVVRAVLDPAVVVFWDADGRITFWSTGAERLFGWTGKEAVGQSAHALLSTSLPKPLTEIVAELRRDGSWRGELRRTARDGRVLHLISQWLPHPDQASCGIVEVSHDITTRKQSEEAQFRLAAIVESSEDAIIGKTLDGVVTSWNAAAEQLFGYSAAEMIGQPLAILIPPDRVQEEELILERIRSGLKVEHYETVRRRKDRTEITASLTISPIRDSRGKVVGASKIVRDITERKEGERALLSREAQLRSILETVPDAMIVIDERGRIQSFSTAAERLFGYTTTEALGRNVAMLMPSPYREAHDGYLARYLSTGERRIIGIGRIVVGRGKDGHTFPIELSVGEVNTEGRRLFTGFIRDLTERHEHDRRLQEVQAELVHMSRLSELAQMVSALAHEVNQPLSAISAYLKASARFLEADDREKAVSIMQRAADQTERASEIVRRLREFVKKGSTEKRVEEIAKVIDEASALALVGTRRGGIRVEMRLDPAARLAIIDKIQIQQVLFNLIRNAIEAMTSSERRELTIATVRRSDAQIEISVSDTGPGLAPEVRSRLFQPFVTTKATGMGVGLSICRSIVEAHGGTLQAEDREDGGTIFRFTVPQGS